jgi:CheY-like chemotaxis protein
MSSTITIGSIFAYLSLDRWNALVGKFPKDNALPASQWFGAAETNGLTDTCGNTPPDIVRSPRYRMTTQPFTILHVEDDPNDVLLVQRALKKSSSPSTIHSVPDGDRALAYLSGQGSYADREKFPIPQLVLLDLKMPRKSGLEVLEWIRSQPNLKRVLVVVFTSSKHDQDIMNAYELGANSYLVKPVGFEALVETMKQIDYYWGTLNQTPNV